MRRTLTKRPPPSGGLGAAALAPLVDLLTLLLVAVLRTWSTDPPVSVPEEGFELPISREERPATKGVVIDIGENGLYVQGWRAGSTEFWTSSEDVLIEGIQSALQSQGGTRALIRAHRAAPWQLVGKVLFTAQQSGYSEIELVAVSQASL